MGRNDDDKPLPGSKPPPIRLAAQGIGSALSHDRPEIRWGRIRRLPAFELFVSERFPEVGPSMRGLELTDELFDTYCEWHARKGQWPNETPCGSLIGASSPAMGIFGVMEA